MKTSSKKAKGRNLQNWCRDRLLESFPKLEKDDIKAAIMGETGADIKLSPAASLLIPFKFECKNSERISIWSAYQQAISHGGSGEPVVIIKRNRQKPLAILDAEYFFQLIKKDNNNGK